MLPGLMKANDYHVTMDALASLCKRRGFIFQTSEIYGGINGFWDYGPLGVELKNNVKRAWWQAMVYERNDMEGLDAAILMNPRTWEASGHLAGFSDPLIDCRVCKNRHRADKLIEVHELRARGPRPPAYGRANRRESSEPWLFLILKVF